MYYDSHTHLNDDKLYPDFKSHLNDFEEIGGAGIVNIGVNEQYVERALQIDKFAKTNTNILSGITIGFDPSEAINGLVNNESIHDKISRLENFYQKNMPNILAIGECGVDKFYNKNSDTLKLQISLFREQCKLASKYNLPLVIHSRDAFSETIEVLSDFKGLKIYFHCWGYSSQEVHYLNKNFENIRIGFTGNITYPKAENIRESSKNCNYENILIETDAPYLSPQVVRGQTNSPKNIKHTYEYISNLLGIEISELKDIIGNNFKNFYGLN